MKTQNQFNLIFSVGCRIGLCCGNQIWYTWLYFGGKGRIGSSGKMVEIRRDDEIKRNTMKEG